MIPKNHLIPAYLLLVLSSNLLLSCGQTQNQSSSVKIIGGQPVSDNQKDNRRWSTVALTTDFSKDKSKPSLLSAGHSFCSGTYIGNRTIVTASHCIQAFDPDTRQKKDEYILPAATDFIVSFSTQVNDADGWIRAEAVIPHPDWSVADTLSPNPTSPPNDLGVIILSEEPPAIARPATIANLNTNPDPGASIDLAGFGITKNRDVNDTGILRQVTTTFSKLDSNSQRFGVGAFLKGACAGDSGGPAYQKVDGEYQVMGATSTGAEFNGYCLGVMANYTDIRYYRDWLMQPK